MGKWKLKVDGCVIPLARDIQSGDWIGHSEVAEYFVDSHNADCDKYEAKIAEFRNELADVQSEKDALTEVYVSVVDELDRVKAESLRVVPDGEPCAAEDAKQKHDFIMRGGSVYMAEPHCWDWRNLDGSFAEINNDIFVQPVRLEHWENAK